MRPEAVLVSRDRRAPDGPRPVASRVLEGRRGAPRAKPHAFDPLAALHAAGSLAAPSQVECLRACALTGERRQAFGSEPTVVVQVETAEVGAAAFSRARPAGSPVVRPELPGYVDATVIVLVAEVGTNTRALIVV